MMHKIYGKAKASNAMPSMVYAALWKTFNNKVEFQFSTFIENIPFSDFKAMVLILKTIPADSSLQLGNSMIIRYANLLGYPHGTLLKSINSNRGTSGIDGTMSTAVGAALATDTITTLITGDLAFFYDKNALWNDHLPANLRIIIINNQGGRIFDLIDGPNQLTIKEKERYFLTPQTLTAKSIASDHQCDYKHCSTVDELVDALETFFIIKSSPAILEVGINPMNNLTVWKAFKTLSL
jgi:2-succinyl-5-enolpyruvyl-6-hydroxy-3-cyclohexene-1-carboxylate synthase